MGRLVHTGLGSSSLVAHVLHLLFYAEQRPLPSLPTLPSYCSTYYKDVGRGGGVKGKGLRVGRPSSNHASWSHLSELYTWRCGRRTNLGRFFFAATLSKRAIMETGEGGKHWYTQT
jgi:hypothetical protein